MRDGSFIRWKAYTIGQLTVTVNLFLSLAVASLGFSFTLLKDEKLILGCWGRVFLAGCLVSFALSVGFGIWCFVNRLLDFRGTAANARKREKLEQMGRPKDEINKELELGREKVKRAEKRTWRIVWFMIGTFFLGVLSLMGCVLIVFG